MLLGLFLVILSSFVLGVPIPRTGENCQDNKQGCAGDGQGNCCQWPEVSQYCDERNGEMICAYGERNPDYPPNPTPECSNGIDDSDEEDYLIDSVDPGCCYYNYCAPPNNYNQDDNDERDNAENPIPEECENIPEECLNNENLLPSENKNIFQSIIDWLVELFNKLLRFFGLMPPETSDAADNSDDCELYKNCPTPPPTTQETGPCEGRIASEMKDEDKFELQHASVNKPGEGGRSIPDLCTDDNKAVREAICNDEKTDVEYFPPIDCPAECKDGVCKRCDINRIIKGNINSELTIETFVSWWPDPKTRTKIGQSIEMNVDKQTKPKLCGVPTKTVYKIKVEGSTFLVAGNKYVNIAETIRDGILLLILKLNRDNPEFYKKVVSQGIIGNGGVIIDLEGTDSKPSFRLLEKKRGLWDLLRPTGVKPKNRITRQGEWFISEITVVYELLSEDNVKVTVSEKLTRDGKTIGSNTKIFTISLEDYKKFIKDMVKLVDSLSKFYDFQIRDGKRVRVIHGSPDTEEQFNNVDEGGTIPLNPKIEKVEVTIEKEEADRMQLEDYLEKTK